MPARSQTRIRRDLNRLHRLIEDKGPTQPALAAIGASVASATQIVNSQWQTYQSAAVKQDKERDERDEATGRLRSWVGRWRPVVLLQVPGASTNLRALPPRGATPDDQVRVADDLRSFIADNAAAAPFRDAALSDLGDGVAEARREASEARSALVEQDGARAALTEASLTANEVLTRGVDVVRAIFGPRSPEARQFRFRAAADTEAEATELEATEDAESEVGES